MTIHSVFTLNLQFFTRLGTREWVDGGGWVWMTRAINSTRHQSWRLGLRWLLVSRFTQKQIYIGICNVFTSNLTFYIPLGDGFSF